MTDCKSDTDSGSGEDDCIGNGGNRREHTAPPPGISSQKGIWSATMIFSHTTPSLSFMYAPRVLVNEKRTTRTEVRLLCLSSSEVEIMPAFPAANASRRYFRAEASNHEFRPRQASSLVACYAWLVKMPLVYSWLVSPVCSTVMRSSGTAKQHDILNALILSTVATCSIQFDIVITIRNFPLFHLASYLFQVHLAVLLSSHYLRVEKHFKRPISS